MQEYSVPALTVTDRRRGFIVGEKRFSRREEEKQRQRSEMFAAALELFSKKGFYNVSMQEIAQRADFAIGTVYKFFKNKEDLYKSMLIEKAQEFHKILKQVLDTKGDPLTVLRDYVAAKGTVFAENVERCASISPKHREQATTSRPVSIEISSPFTTKSSRS